MLTDPAQPTTHIRDELPPTAALPAVLQTVACRLWPLAYFERCRARYGNRFTIQPVDMPPLVFLSDPGEIRAVFTAPPGTLHPGAGGSVVAPLFGEESFTLCEEGAQHTSGRNAILPAFSRRVTLGREEILAEVVGRDVRSWPVDSPFATYPRLRALMLRVIMRSIFGREDSAFEELHGRLLHMVAVMASFLLQEPRLRHLPGWHTKWKRFVRHREEVDRSIAALVAQRRRSHRRSEDLLDMLLAESNPDGSPMSAGQIRDNLVSVVIAGHETTASQLAWAFQLLAHNPAVQERLVEEIDGKAGEEYMTATILETLRHRPVFPFAAPRAVVAPIEIGGCTYRPPTQLLACTYLVHHDPALYPAPHEFRPERFLESPPNPRMWLPWGGGHRRCLGQHFAMAQMRAVLRAVLAEHLVLPAGGRVERARWRSVIVTPHAGSRVILRRRGPRTEGVPIGTDLFQSERIPGYPAGQPS
jgi:cytochrome P450